MNNAVGATLKLLCATLKREALSTESAFLGILIQLECHTNTRLVPTSATEYKVGEEEVKALSLAISLSLWGEAEATCMPSGIPFPRTVGLQHQHLRWESRTLFQFTLPRQFSLNSLQHYISAVSTETNLMTIYWSLVLKARGTHKDNSCETENRYLFIIE